MGKYPVKNLPAENSDRALVDYCLGKKVALTARAEDDETASVAVLAKQNRNKPAVVEAIVVVGILGNADDAAEIEPFLESANEQVAINAAVACLRLGVKEKAVAALERMARGDVTTQLYYVTRALRVLKQAKEPSFDGLMKTALTAVGRREEISPNWLTEFLMLAAEDAKGVWK
jgi:hypothetical protein